MHNLKFLIVGDDDSASRFVEAIHESPETTLIYNIRGRKNVRSKFL